MDWGMKNRLSQIIKPNTGRTVMLAVDHGYFLGPVKRLEKPGQTIAPLLPYVDALMPTRGVVRNCVDPGNSKPLVLRVSGGNSILKEDISNEELTTSMEDAIRLNVAAVAISIYIGTEHEHQTIISLAKLINEGQKWGIPVLAVTAVGKELEKRDARYLSLCCRIAAETGAQFIKTYYCEDFEKVVNTCPVPLVIAGGPKMKSELNVLEVAEDAIKKGACGVDFGRNIWQSSNPTGMVQAVRSIVHENATAKEAFEQFMEPAASKK